MKYQHLALGFLSIGTAFAWMGSAQAATLTHQYNLNGNLNDSIGTANLVSGGGTVSPTGYAFGANQGLTLSNAINQASYSILLEFSYTNPNLNPGFSPYSKIVDFKNLGFDNGLYYKGGFLNFFGGQNGSVGGTDIANGTTPITANSPLKLALTRDAMSGQTTAYLNGVQQFSFVDGAGESVFNVSPSFTSNNIVNFFNDDSFTGGSEASSGLVTRIAIYDGALSAADASILTGGSTAVPEPFTVVGTLIGGTAALRLRKKLKATDKV